MDDNTFWAICFAQIASMKFHPRNPVGNAAAQVKACAEIADLMLIQRNLSCPHMSEPE